MIYCCSVWRLSFVIFILSFGWGSGRSAFKAFLRCVGLFSGVKLMPTIMGLCLGRA